MPNPDFEVNVIKAIDRSTQAQTSTAITTLASAIIQARGAKTIQEFMDATTDARHILASTVGPVPHQPSHNVWLLKSGITPT